MNPSQQVIFAFDPGNTTGFAALTDECKILHTSAVIFSRLSKFLVYLMTVSKDVEVVVEVGPDWGHHSPVTKTAEATILETFPNAHRVPPNRWKNHPASKTSGRKEPGMTTHESDAVRLGRWFINTGGINAKRQDTTGENN